MGIYDEIADARRAAHTTDGVDDIETVPGDDSRWLQILMEQVGKVANQMADDDRQPDPDEDLSRRQRLRDELVRIGAVAAAWADKLSDAPACDHYGFVRTFRNRSGHGAAAFEIREHVKCIRCGESFGDHLGRP